MIDNKFVYDWRDTIPLQSYLFWTNTIEWLPRLQWSSREQYG